MAVGYGNEHQHSIIHLCGSIFTIITLLCMTVTEKLLKYLGINL